MSHNKAFLIAAQTGVPVLATGEPGTSKTRTTEAFAKFLGREYECLIGSQHDPVDIAGLPRHRVLPDGTEVFGYVRPEWRHRLETAPNGGLLHLDELFDCPPSVQAAMLQILGDGIPNTLIVATANPVDLSTNGFSLGAPVVNRLCWLNWETPYDSWKKGLIRGWDHVNNDFPVLPETWRSQIGIANMLILDFLNRASDFRQEVPKTFAGNPSPYPTLRSWTNTGILLGACWSVDAGPECEDALVAGCVGEGAAAAFRKFWRQKDLPNPEHLLKDPSLFKPEKIRGDQAVVILASVVSAVLRNNTEERWLQAWELIGRQCDVAADVAASVAGPLSQNRPKVDVFVGDAQGKTSVAIPKHVQLKLYEILQHVA